MTQDIDTICYTKNFLKEVIFKIDFSPILKINTEEPAAFQEKIKQPFEILEITQIQEFETTFSADSPSGTKINSYPQYNFFNKNKTIKITLTSSSLIIQDFKYDRYSLFESFTTNVVNEFCKLYKPINVKRIGLRFLNEIIFEAGNPFEWSNYIAKPLVAAIENFFEPKQEISRSIGQTYLNKSDHTLKFTYGLHNKNSFPAQVSRKQLILDYDCFTQTVDEGSILSFLDVFHNEIQSLFEKSITNELRTIMGVKTYAQK